MVRVFIPTMLQFLTSGVKDLSIDAGNIADVIDILEEKFPGMCERLLVDGNLVSTVVVSIDGQVSRLGLLQKVEEESEVHFVPNMGGGSNGMSYRFGHIRWDRPGRFYHRNLPVGLGLRYSKHLGTVFPGY